MLPTKDDMDGGSAFIEGWGGTRIEGWGGDIGDGGTIFIEQASGG